MYKIKRWCNNSCNVIHHRALDVATLPLNLQGIVTEEHFQDFVRTINEYISMNDDLITRRSTIGAWCPMLLYLLIVNIYYYYLVLPKFGSKIPVDPFLVQLAILLIIYILFSKVLLRKQVQEIADEMSEVHRNIQTTCTDMSQRVTTSLPSSSPVIHVNCTLRSKTRWDFIGSYKYLDYLVLSINSTLEDTEGSHRTSLEGYQVVLTSKMDALTTTIV
jgi:hypothetical protein